MFWFFSTFLPPFPTLFVLSSLPFSLPFFFPPFLPLSPLPSIPVLEIVPRASHMFPQATLPLSYIWGLKRHKHSKALSPQISAVPTGDSCRPSGHVPKDPVGRMPLSLSPSHHHFGYLGKSEPGPQGQLRSGTRAYCVRRGWRSESAAY